MRRLQIAFVFCLCSAASLAQLVGSKLPMKPNSVRFAVIGDSGTGLQPQYDVAQKMTAAKREFSFQFVLMLGDNIYGGKTPEDFKNKFELPYKPLLDDGVKFYASLGNHDDTNERLYQPFNMDGKRFYDFKKGNVEFFALDSNYMDPQQLDWLRKELESSRSTWKICYFHHPLYSHARAHGPDVDLRKRVEPIFEKYGVNVVLAGHQHSYERLKPHHGISYFVLGNSGQLRPHDLKASSDTAKSYDSDQAFALFEVVEGDLYFEVISRTGALIDSGTVAANAAKRD